MNLITRTAVWVALGGTSEDPYIMTSLDGSTWTRTNILSIKDNPINSINAWDNLTAAKHVCERAKQAWEYARECKKEEKKSAEEVTQEAIEATTEGLAYSNKYWHIAQDAWGNYRELSKETKSLKKAFKKAETAVAAAEKEWNEVLHKLLNPAS